jgi:hypothetical protein
LVHSGTTDKFSAGTITITRPNSNARLDFDDLPQEILVVNDITTYPNPTSGEFRIMVNGKSINKEEDVILTITNIMSFGYIYSESSTLAELVDKTFNLEKGTYVIRVQSTETRKPSVRK